MLLKNPFFPVSPSVHPFDRSSVKEVLVSLVFSQGMNAVLGVYLVEPLAETASGHCGDGEETSDSVSDKCPNLFGDLESIVAPFDCHLFWSLRQYHLTDTHFNLLDQ